MKEEKELVKNETLSDYLSINPSITNTDPLLKEEI